MRIARITLAIALAAALAGALATPGSGAPTAKPAKAAARATSAPRVRPDLSGTWVLDTARSELGEFPGQPDARIDRIQQRGAVMLQTIVMERGGKRDTTTYRYVTDSSRVVNRLDHREIESRVWWEGAVLRLESSMRMLVFDLWTKERWSVAPDGRTLTVARRVKYPMMEGDQTLVFSRR